VVPDAVTTAMLPRRLDAVDAAGGFLLDGCPRTSKQAHELDAMLSRVGRELDLALVLRADNDEVIRRLSGRRTCRTCAAAWHVEFRPTQQENTCDRCGGELYQRDDDSPATVRTRLRAYHAHTAPLISFYAEDDRLAEVDAVGAVEDVTDAVLHTVAQMLGRTKGRRLRTQVA
jgi:adenylate kinase